MCCYTALNATGDLLVPVTLKYPGITLEGYVRAGQTLAGVNSIFLPEEASVVAVRLGWAVYWPSAEECEDPDPAKSLSWDEFLKYEAVMAEGTAVYELLINWEGFEAEKTLPDPVLNPPKCSFCEERGLEPADIPVKVCRSAAGWYVGQFCPNCGPIERLSLGYFDTELGAKLAVPMYVYV